MGNLFFSKVAVLLNSQKFLTLMVMALLLTANLQSIGVAAPKIPNGDFEHKQIKEEFASLFENQRFESIDKRLAHLLKTDERRSDGGHTHYSAFSGISGDLRWMDGGRLKTHFLLLRKWKEKHPESIYMNIAFAAYYLERSRRYRGGSYASNISKQQRNTYIRHAYQAIDYLSKAIDLPADDPLIYDYQIQARQLSAQGFELMKQAFEEGERKFPNYLIGIDRMSLYLKPEWYGDKGSLERFAQTISKNHSQDWLYTLVFLNTLTKNYLENLNVLQMSGFEWEKVKRGFVEKIKKYPSADLLSQFAWFSMLANDKLRTQKLLRQLGSDLDTNYWGNADYKSWVDWANLPVYPILEKDKKTWESRVVNHNNIYGDLDKDLNGVGEYRFNQGVFQGQFINGSIDGWGRWVSDSLEMKGFFKGEKLNGAGVQNDLLNKKYLIGHFVKGSLQGYGKEVAESGESYLGRFNNGKKEGVGFYRFNERFSYYIGEFKNNKPNGFGVTSNLDLVRQGQYYIGNHKDGKPHGLGLIFGPELTYKFGLFKKGVRQKDVPQGIRLAYSVVMPTPFFPNEPATYIGGYINGKAVGTGVIITERGDIYLGHFSNGIWHGEAIQVIRSSKRPYIRQLMYDNGKEGDGYFEIMGGSRLEGKLIDNTFVDGWVYTLDGKIIKYHDMNYTNAVSYKLPVNVNVGFEHKEVIEGEIHLYRPTYRGKMINSNRKTYIQYCKELGLEFVKAQVRWLSPDGMRWSDSPSYGFNYDKWEIHPASFKAWFWDDAYSRPYKIIARVPIEK